MNKEEIKNTRLKLNMTQREMASRLSLSERTIQRYESGEYCIPINVISGIQRIVKRPEFCADVYDYLTFEEIANSFDSVVCCEIETIPSNSQYVVVLGMIKETEGYQVCNFMLSDRIEYIGRYIDGGSYFITDESELTDKVILRALYDIFLDKKFYVRIPGIGFDKTLEDDPEDEHRKGLIEMVKQYKREVN